MKLVILNCPDMHPIESFREMLASAGYETKLAGSDLRQALRNAGLPYVLHWSDLKHMGYLAPSPAVPEASLEDFYRCDLFADLKVNGCRKALETWTHLRDRVLWYRIQGGEPEITEKGGDEINLPCPVLTANHWYRGDQRFNKTSYVCWLPFVREAAYSAPRPTEFFDPVTLIHSVHGWGYGAIVNELRSKLSLRIHGAPSPDSCLENSQVPALLNRALCYVQLRSNDSPGYALYEAIAARCPLIVPRRFIKRMAVEDLFVDRETCLCFDAADGDCASELWAEGCIHEIARNVALLKDPVTNKVMAERMCRKFREQVWTPMRDANSFREFMQRNFA